MPTYDSKDIEKIIARADRDQYNREKKSAHSTTGRLEQETVSFQKFFTQVTYLVIWIYQNLIHPLYRPIYNGIIWTTSRYIRLWNLAVHVPDKYGEKIFSKGRALSFLFGTFMFIILLPTMGDTVLYFATIKHETVYLHNSQEILPIENVHSVQGCFKLPCNDADAIYFRIRPTIFNEIWSLIHHRTWFFPDYVAAAVPPVVNKCEAVTYGVRFKLFMRGLNVYPDLLDVSCQPLAGQ